MIDDYDLSVLVGPLQSWFPDHARNLPWRARSGRPNPYYVWVSEIMLQQTRVEAVKSYFNRFISKLPDVAALAACREEELLKLWEGLGYYNRARNLQAAARQVMEDYGGQLPADYGELLKLKGIGHYTAGAIASIAYGLPVPAVDGNVLRVLSRVAADDSDIMRQSVRTHMEDVLGALMQTDQAVHPPVFNQALMELGAIVCVPNGKPYCENCPWKELCLARAENRIGTLPVKARPKKRRIVDLMVLVIRFGNRVAIHRRPGDGLLAGLYEFPNQEGYDPPEVILEKLRERGYQPCRIERLPDAKHIFSHVEWHMKGYAVELEALPDGTEEWTKELLFVEVEDVYQHYAIPTAFSAYMKYMARS